MNPINDAPAFLSNQLALASGDAVVLTSADLAASDADGPAGALLFTVSGLSGGHFELTASPGGAIASFTQAQVAAGEVRFVHDGITAAPAYEVEVSDGAATVGPMAAQIQLTSLPAAPVILPLVEPPASVPTPEPALARDGGIVDGGAATLGPLGGHTAAIEPIGRPSDTAVSEVAWHLASPSSPRVGASTGALDVSWTHPRARQRELSAELQTHAFTMANHLLASIEEVREDLARHQIETSMWRRASVEAVSIAFSAGFIAAALRSTSLWAAMLSLMPMWQRLDPLVVLAVSDEERRRRQDEIRRAEERRSKVGRVLDESDRGSER